MTLVNLRGSNGAGKSTIVRQLLDGYPSEPLYELFDHRPQAYELRIPDVAKPVYVLGPYETPTGGCDSVQPYSLITYLLNSYAPLGHVLFEGALISDNYGRVGEWLEKHGKDAAVLFLDTPLTDCIQRVKARQVKARKARTKDAGTKHIEKRYHSIAKVRKRMLRDNKLRVIDVSVETGKDVILKLLRGELQGTSLSHFLANSENVSSKFCA